MKKNRTLSLALATTLISSGVFAGSLDFANLEPYEQAKKFQQMDEQGKTKAKRGLQELAKESPANYQASEASLVNALATTYPDFKDAYWNKVDVYEGTTVFKRNMLIDVDAVNYHDGSKENMPYVNRLAMLEGVAPVGPDGKQVELCRIVESKNASYFEMASTDVRPILSLLESDMDIQTACLSKELAANYWKARHGDFFDKYGDTPHK